MKRLIKTSMLGGLAFAALTLGSDRTADACNGEPPPPPEPCAFDYHPETRKLDVVVRVVSKQNQQSSCGCGQTLELPEGADIVDAGFIGPDGVPTSEFCDSTRSAETQAAFNAGLPGAAWASSWFSAVSTSGITAEQEGWAWYTVANIGADEFPSRLALGEIDIDAAGNATLNPTHQWSPALAKAKCTVCEDGVSSEGCTAVASIHPPASGGGGPVVTARPVKTCLSKEATDLIARERGELGGGCDASRARAPSIAGFMLMLGAALVLRRRRRS